MERYHFVEVWDWAGTLYVNCTDPVELELLVKEVTQHQPKVKIETAELPSGERYHYRLKGVVQGKDPFPQPPMEFLVVRQLCSRGWEPLGALNGGANSSVLRYQFRRMTNV